MKGCLSLILLLAMIFTVSTNDSIPVLTKYRPNITVKSSGTFQLDCPIELQSTLIAPQPTNENSAGSGSSLQSLMISWTIRNIDENLIASDPRYEFFNHSRRVKITNAKVSDSGVYKCRGVTGFGTQEAKFHVTVLDNESCLLSDSKTNQRPCFVDATMQSSKNKIKTIHKSVGSSVEFRCDALGNPAPTYLWFYEDSLVDHRRSTGGVRHSSLVLHDLRREYKGHYTCKVANKYGKISFTFALVVKDSPSALPKIIEPMVNQSITIGTPGVLIGKIHCQCKPIIQWLQRVQNNNAGNQPPYIADKPRRRSHISLPKAASTESGESFTILDVDSQDYEASGSSAIISDSSSSSSDISIENIYWTDRGIIESRLKFKSMQAWHAGKYALLTMSQQKANVNDISYKTVFLKVSTSSGERATGSLNSLKSSQSTPKVIIYISVPGGVLLLCVFVIFYCLIRHRTHYPSASHHPTHSLLQPANGCPVKASLHMTPLVYPPSMGGGPPLHMPHHPAASLPLPTSTPYSLYPAPIVHPHGNYPPPPSSNSSIHQPPHSSPTQSSIIVPTSHHSHINCSHHHHCYPPPSYTSSSSSSSSLPSHHNHHRHNHHHPPSSDLIKPPPSSTNSNFKLPPSLCFDTESNSLYHDHHHKSSNQNQHSQNNNNHSSLSSTPYFPGHNSSSSASLTYS